MKAKEILEQTSSTPIITVGGQNIAPGHPLYQQLVNRLQQQGTLQQPGTQVGTQTGANAQPGTSPTTTTPGFEQLKNMLVRLQSADIQYILKKLSNP